MYYFHSNLSSWFTFRHFSRKEQITTHTHAQMNERTNKMRYAYRCDRNDDLIFCLISFVSVLLLLLLLFRSFLSLSLSFFLSFACLYLYATVSLSLYVRVHMCLSLYVHIYVCVCVYSC